jgi:hypothetical protein
MKKIIKNEEFEIKISNTKTNVELTIILSEKTLKKALLRAGKILKIDKKNCFIECKIL